MTKSELRAVIKKILKEELVEARKKNPPAPAKLEIIKIEPNIQQNFGAERGTVRHYDLIIYKDPIGGFENRTMVFEENPGFGKYFGWGDKHSVDGWCYAAYDYEGNLVPGIDPSTEIPEKHKKAISDIVSKINNPSDFDKESKKTALKDVRPAFVYMWDMYIDINEKGMWTSANKFGRYWTDYIYETPEKAKAEGMATLSALAADGELEGNPSDYTIDTVAIPLSEIDADMLEDNDLAHLI